MASKLIELEEDGVLVEVDVAGEQAQEISGGAAELVGSTLGKIKPLLIKTCKPIVAAWQELSQDMEIEQAEVQLGLSFEGEGNLYIAKSKGGANLTIKLVLKPKKDA